MRIGVVSDTHMPKRGKVLPAALREGLQGVDLILHAGDWQTLAVYDMLAEIAPVNGVAGNVDGEELVERFGRKKIISAGNFRIGLVHGDGKGKTTEQRALAAFAGEEVDVIVFGHSHIPLLKEENGIRLFNPGSATDKRKQPLFSYGLITVEDAGISLEHVFYLDKSGERVSG
ncbi:metallophosphoesterase family protein [Tumebacillus flagellatus]|uniref:Phosphoesterase n=1 Tax=Tumebacillus flagellatus TaxID=1157490 RepID=A0A074LRV5_9BACL|nr:metallophosphoesterase [Tumebacillus flagellatus]KEO84881.1 phosphodiesterase [Tumebacillus flagellatus]